VALRTGDRTEDLTFVQPDGSSIRLAAFAGRPLLLVFLRHLA
jgi:peroxiredoxin